jgi:hypothetical protein
LPWGGTYGLPTRNQELGVAHYSYRTDPAGVVADRRIVTRYSDRWLRDTLAQAGKGSVGELLVAQGRSVRVRAAQERASARSAQIWKAGIVFGIAGLALIVACLILGPTMAMGRPRPWLARRQMEA